VNGREVHTIRQERWLESRLFGGVHLHKLQHSLVITIDLVSTDSLGAAPSGALGLTKDTCGQTVE